MPDKYHAFRGVLIALLLPAVFAGKMGSAEPALTEQTLQAIEDCMYRSPSQWPDEWRQQYLETIRKAVALHQDNTHYVLRLEILRRGFAPCWERLTKIKDRSLFEVYRARMRWYTEHLMGSKFPTEAEKQEIREQYTDIWDYAANSLLAQFPFLDPNAVQKAKTDDLSVCYGKIDAPLMPVYMRPLYKEQVKQIKQRWDKMRYVRVDLWRKLNDSSTTQSKNGNASSIKAQLDYKFTKESLSQLLGQVWMVIPERPIYYLEAMQNRIKALKQRFQSRRKARSQQRRLEEERSRQLLQVEHIGFLLVCLLESPQCFEDYLPNITKVQIPLERQDKTLKGGGAYEVGNILRVK
ncbi:MAG: hypothetical protein RQ760_14190 [Sedimentisphaerales bacterium]|nr:hypothetical protein [Sedimentisphaerales bacterium]